MDARFIVLIGTLSGLMGISIIAANAQEKKCSSRVIEETVKTVAREKFGPPPAVALQSWATIGRGPEVRVTVLDIGDLKRAQGGPSCAATITVWREDTQETIHALMQFTILENSIHLDSLERQ